jgi:hypothetical protein
MVQCPVRRFVLVSVLAAVAISLWTPSSEAGRWFHRQRRSSGCDTCADQGPSESIERGPWYLYRFPDDTVKVAQAAIMPGSVEKISTNTSNLAQAEKFLTSLHVAPVDDTNWIAQKCGTGSAAWYWIVHTNVSQCTGTFSFCPSSGSYSNLKYIVDNAVLSKMASGQCAPAG